MNGQLYIDNIDIFARYGVMIEEGGHNGVLSYPSLKEPEQSNDWLEEDGIEVDLSDPQLNTKEFDIQFIAFNEYMAGDFMALLSDGAYHAFQFNKIGKSFVLRLVDESSKTQYVKAERFTLKFADDFPLDSYTYIEPSSNTVDIQGYELDNRDFSEYGIMVLEGSEAQILKSPAVKQNLLRNLSNREGAIYDGQNVVFQQKEVVLNCCLIATDLDEFWRNYNAFLYDLIRVNESIDNEGYTVRSAERSLYYEATGEEYPCYYKTSKVSLFSPNGRIWCKFTLTLVFTSFRVGEDEFLLATEASELVATEDGEYYIDLKSYGN